MRTGLLDIAPSPANCLEFCQGTISEMASQNGRARGTEVVDAVRQYARQGKIAYVHFRAPPAPPSDAARLPPPASCERRVVPWGAGNVVGQVPHYKEVFIDEGDIDMHACLQEYKEAGFDGVFIPECATRPSFTLLSVLAQPII